MVFYDLDQRSPPFLAPGTGFVEDNFSTDRGGVGRGWQCGDGTGGNVSDGERWGATDEASLAHRSPPAVRPGS